MIWPILPSHPIVLPPDPPVVIWPTPPQPGNGDHVDNSLPQPPPYVDNSLPPFVSLPIVIPPPGPPAEPGKPGAIVVWVPGVGYVVIPVGEQLPEPPGGAHVEPHT
jgi:hypothetical protein